jgi:hypothetical protein
VPNEPPVSMAMSNLPQYKQTSFIFLFMHKAVNNIKSMALKYFHKPIEEKTFTQLKMLVGVITKSIKIIVSK